ncbi:hypothetical protein [Halonatronum saccharophilum]|uniref:hypothetical protein n=1 Tax=Halonatronum saccharophilum TaxID=150060 RepID=UPI000483C5E1|nr:hypothetical protein [Halonatronum saccharophilum]
MLKYNEEIAKLLLRLKNKSDVKDIKKDDAIKGKVNCPICNCESQEHEEYSYCEVVSSYICDICCRYEVCNDYKLVNKALKKEVFKDNKELIALCEYCN